MHTLARCVPLSLRLLLPRLRPACQAVPTEQGLLVLWSLQNVPLPGHLPQEPGRPCRSPHAVSEPGFKLFSQSHVDFKMDQLKKKPVSPPWGKPVGEGALLRGTASTHKGGRGRGTKPAGRVHFCAAAPQTLCCPSAHRGRGQAVLPRPATRQGGPGVPLQPATAGATGLPKVRSEIWEANAASADSTPRSTGSRAPDCDHAAPPPPKCFPTSLSTLSTSTGQLPQKGRFVGQ